MAQLLVCNVQRWTLIAPQTSTADVYTCWPVEVMQVLQLTVQPSLLLCTHVMSTLLAAACCNAFSNITMDAAVGLLLANASAADGVW